MMLLFLIFIFLGLMPSIVNDMLTILSWKKYVPSIAKTEAIRSLSLNMLGVIASMLLWIFLFSVLYSR